MKNRACGFTIVELLVVIIIVMIVATLLLPAFFTAKDRAKATVCISNLKQVYAALTLYQADNNDVFPPNSFTFSGFKQYYPTLLECPVSKNYASFRTHEFDYQAAWQFSRDQIGGSTEGAMGAFDDYDQCKTIRLGMLPLAADVNHMKQKPTPGDYYIILRTNGAVNVVGRPVQLINSPCNVLRGLPVFFNL